jgi:integrase
LKAFVLLLRWSGLRITDAVSLERHRIDAGGNLTLVTRKTGSTVRLPLPPQCIEALAALPTVGPRFFMEPGEKRTTANERYREQLRVAWSKTGLKTRCYPHKFRHSFAINLLLNGTPMDLVSKLLGHSTILITMAHYNSFVRARQDQLDANVRETWK